MNREARVELKEQDALEELAKQETTRTEQMPTTAEKMGLKTTRAHLVEQQ